MRADAAIVARGDIGGRGQLEIWEEHPGGKHRVLQSCWEDVGTAGVSAVMELAETLAVRLGIEFRDETT